MKQLPIINLPVELDLPASYGFTMKGWDFDSNCVRDAITQHRMLNPAMELGSNICPWNCDFCFTEQPANPDGRKRRLATELSIEKRLHLIDTVATLGAKSINFVGAGEPTIDPDFWQIVERMAENNITPIIYSEGSLKLKHPEFSARLFELGATIVLKINSLNNTDYQDKVLRGVRPKTGVPQSSYSAERQKALDTLLDIGFNNCTPTRLAFDTIICKENINEIEYIHEFARHRNIFVLFVNYLPSGRTSDGHTSAISWEEQHQLFQRLAEIDKREFGISHSTHFPYSGGVPCTIRGLGIYLKIQGEVFDCPGESLLLGNVNETPLEELWNQVRPITEAFDGGCFPREQFWETHNCPGST